MSKKVFFLDTKNIKLAANGMDVIIIRSANAEIYSQKRKEIIVSLEEKSKKNLYLIANKQVWI